MKVIYIIICKKSNKHYVGSAMNDSKRKREHFKNLQKGIHPNKKLQSSFDKHGLDFFEFKILEVVEETKNLLSREQHYIDTLKPFFNICQIAGSSIGLKRSEATKDKVRKANLGLRHPQWRNEIKSKAQGGENHWTKKKGFSKRSRDLMSASHKEKYLRGYESPVRKPINQLDLGGNTIKPWESIAKAANELGINRKGISQCLTGRSKTSNNFKWEYIQTK